MPFPKFSGLVEGLQRGADIVIARSLAVGASIDAVVKRVGRLFVNPTPTITNQIRNIAAGEVAAGRAMSSRPAGEVMPARDAFLQPHLFGDESDGRRTLTGVDFIGPDGNRIIHIAISDDGTRSLAEQLLEAMTDASDIIGRYPGKFPGVNPNDVNSMQIDIQYAARRF